MLPHCSTLCDLKHPPRLCESPAVSHVKLEPILDFTVSNGLTVKQSVFDKIFELLITHGWERTDITHHRHPGVRLPQVTHFSLILVLTTPAVDPNIDSSNRLNGGFASFLKPPHISQQCLPNPGRRCSAGLGAGEPRSRRL